MSSRYRDEKIAGSISWQGRYDESQQVYRVIKSCLMTGLGIQGYSNDMAPTPVDDATRTVVVLADRDRDGGGIFHISSSEQRIGGMFERCNEIVGTALELLPYYAWVQQMRRLHNRGHSLPVAPVIDVAFPMDAKQFAGWQSSTGSTKIHFDLRYTHAELEKAAVVAPALDHELLRVCIENIVMRDHELRAAIGRRPNAACQQLSFKVEREK